MACSSFSYFITLVQWCLLSTSRSSGPRCRLLLVITTAKIIEGARSQCILSMITAIFSQSCMGLAAQGKSARKIAKHYKARDNNHVHFKLKQVQISAGRKSFIVGCFGVSSQRCLYLSLMTLLRDKPVNWIVSFQSCSVVSESGIASLSQTNIDTLKLSDM